MLLVHQKDQWSRKDFIDRAREFCEEIYLNDESYTELNDFRYKIDLEMKFFYYLRKSLVKNPEDQFEISFKIAEKQKEIEGFRKEKIILPN